MRPPICAICDRDIRDYPDLKFDLVRFADFEAIEGPGHPDGLEWFCSDHIKQAQERELLFISDAIREIKKKENSLFNRIVKKFRG